MRAVSSFCYYRMIMLMFMILIHFTNITTAHNLNPSDLIINEYSNDTLIGCNNITDTNETKNDVGHIVALSFYAACALFFIVLFILMERQHNRQMYIRCCPILFSSSPRNNHHTTIVSSNNTTSANDNNNNNNKIVIKDIITHKEFDELPRIYYKNNCRAYSSIRNNKFHNLNDNNDNIIMEEQEDDEEEKNDVENVIVSIEENTIEGTYDIDTNTTNNEAINENDVVVMESSNNSTSRDKYIYYTNSNNNEVCSICVEEFNHNELVIMLPICKHLYHIKCIQLWLLERKATFCPTCKTDVMNRKNNHIATSLDWFSSSINNSSIYEINDHRHHHFRHYNHSVTDHNVVVTDHHTHNATYNCPSTFHTTSYYTNDTTTTTSSYSTPACSASSYSAAADTTSCSCE